MDAQWQGSTLVLLSAMFYGLLPIFARFAYASGAEVPELLFVRFCLSFLMLGAFLGLRGKIAVPPKRQLIALVGLGGLGYFLQSTFYFNALLYIPVSVVSLVLYTYPAFVAAGSLVFGIEKVSKKNMVSLLLALVGLVLVVDPELNLSAYGLLLALGAALTYTTYILVSARTLRMVSGETSSFFIIGAAAISFGIFAASTGGIQLAWNEGEWVWAFMLALVSTSLAVTFFFKGLRLVGPTRASILSTVELITSVFAAALIFGETLGPLQVIGGVLIMLATVIAALHRV